MIITEKINDNLVRYYSDLGLKIQRIDNELIYNAIADQPNMESKYREIKEFIDANPAYAEEAALYKTLLDTVTGEEGEEE